MKYCPECGKKLDNSIHVESRNVHVCTCGFIDWDNWVNVSAVTVGFNAQGEFLMVRMKETGKLTFPGGYRNLGESMEDATKRECLEESGYVVDDLELLNVYALDQLRLIWIIYKANIISGSFVDNDEVSEAIFVSPEHPPQDDMLRGSLSVRLLHEIIDKTVSK